MRRVGREQEHAAFVDDYVFEFGRGWRCGFVNYFQEHGAFVLVEPFGCFVDVVIGSCIGSSYYLFVVNKLSLVDWKYRDSP